MPRICSVQNCQRSSSRRGWCESHYRRWLRYGDPLAGRRQNGAAEEFLYETALLCESAECLIWPYQKTENGYGKMWWSGGQKIVSRLVCELVHGQPPSPNYDAAHTCGNGSVGCVNPNHLVWKTHKENEADKIAHGTANRGERHGLAKLSKDDVHRIRSMRETAPIGEIAAQFGVQETTVRHIYAGRTWGWLPYRRDMVAAGRGHLLTEA